MTLRPAGLLSVALLAALSATAAAADAQKGEVLAKRWCAACHIVSSEQSRGTTQAPPFAEVARKAGFDQGMLAYFLLVPHPKMPDMNLSRTEAADLAAFIAMQR
jgi:mono/diheme cytochrome c family protein